MAILHQATINPTKDQVVGPWLETRPWWDGIAERGPVGTFRLDDPAGEVGIECFLFGSASGSTLFVPVTYRSAPLPDGDAHLLGTMQHSVLGERWVHDGCGDPVFVTTLAETIRTGGTHARLDYHRADGSVVEREPTATARGSGAADLADITPDQVGRPTDHDDRTVVSLGALTLTVVRRVGAELPAGPGLVARFAGGTDLVLATIG
ncbi:hypothetical protein ASG90_19700 [Nocardioides sp. Soil797]|nr:hypothetical protein ASG90_19700 [Nocardioides sp. Soil797]